VASDKRYKKRKKKGRLAGKILAALASILIVCIAGGLVIKTVLPSVMNEKMDTAPLSAETAIKQSDNGYESRLESDASRTADESLPDSQIPVAIESEKEMKSPEEVAKERDAWVEEQLAGMEMEEKVAQLFFVSADTLTQVVNTTTAGDTFKARFEAYPVGGVALLDGNVVSPDQLKSLTGTARELSKERVGLDLFIGVEEEGGSVLQIADKPEFGLNDVGRMTDIGAGDDIEAAYKAGDYLGSYLSEYGINVDFAPMADVIYNIPNSVVKDRAFGQDPILVSDMVSKEVEGLKKWNVSAVLKHFPGHGTTEGDPAEGDAVSLRTPTELETNDYMPFRKGIEAGADFVMVGHIIMQTVSPEAVPASVSSYFMTDILRNEWGYDGIVITDDMSMAAISNRYSNADAAVAAINAGADMVFLTSGFEDAFWGVMEAVNDGVIPNERIDESVQRILRVKYMKQYNDKS